MTTHHVPSLTLPPIPRRRALAVALLVAASVATTEVRGQDRLKTMPGYDQYQAMSGKIQGAVKSGALTVRWLEGGKALEYRKDGSTWHYDLATGKLTGRENAAATESESQPASRPASRSGERGGERGGNRAGGRGGNRGGGRGGAPARERGRQFASAASPDGKLEAFCRDRNLWLRAAGGGDEEAITTAGDEKARIKFATASWVYGEELNQTTAMWWSPDSTRIAFYRFDESKTPDYYLQLDQTKVQSRVDVEAYPKAGAPNPIADLLVYDLGSKATVTVDVRDGKPFADEVLGHYAYNVSWSQDGSELLFHRTNRRQNTMELCAADPATGKCRVVLREEWLPSWTDNSPARRFLADGRRFVWTSDRTGFKNLYLYELGGKLLATLTSHPFDVGSVVRLDEAAGQLWYMARSGDNHMKLQLHRVNLDGTGDQRLTDPAFLHAVDVAPDGRHFVDVAQTHDTPPVTRLLAASGKIVKELAQSDLSGFESLGLRRVELFRYKAGDGTTELHGMLHFPSKFDPTKKHPLLVTVYGGPATNGARETFTTPNPLTEYGFLVASLDSRSAGGRGKRFLDAIYQKLGVVEIDDLAAGVRSLWSRPYLNKERVGIFGTSYGGYASVMCLLRHPDAFQAACASSPVTDWRHYDTIYTERYMWTPQENKAGYDAGSAMTYADQLRGRLMLFYGTADNNVHPNNTMQLVGALQRAGRSLDLQVGPDRGHSGISNERMMEFFLESLVLR